MLQRNEVVIQQPFETERPYSESDRRRRMREEAQGKIDPCSGAIIDSGVMEAGSEELTVEDFVGLDYHLVGGPLTKDEMKMLKELFL